MKQKRGDVFKHELLVVLKYKEKPPNPLKGRCCFYNMLLFRNLCLSVKAVKANVNHGFNLQQVMRTYLLIRKS